MYCARCGFILTEGAVFCRQCGQNVTAEVPQKGGIQPNPEGSPNAVRIANPYAGKDKQIWGVLLIIVGFLIAIVGFASEESGVVGVVGLVIVFVGLIVAAAGKGEHWYHSE